MKIFKNQNT